MEEIIKRLQGHKGVQGIIVVNSDGIPIRSTLADVSLTTQYAALISQLTSKAKLTVKELDSSVYTQPIHYDLSCNFNQYM